MVDPEPGNRRGTITHEPWRAVPQKLIHKPLSQQRRCEPCTTFDQDPRQPFMGKCPKRCAEVQPRIRRRHGQDPHVESLELMRRLGPRRQQPRCLPRGPGAQHRTRRKPRLAVDDNPDEATMLHAGQAAGQFRIIGENGADAHDNGIMLRTDKMGVTTRGFSRDPLALAGGKRNPSIKCGCQLERDERSSPLDAGKEARVQGTGLAFKHAGMHLDPGVPQKGMSAPRDTRVRILKRRHDTRNAGRLQGLGAWPGLAVMGAGFKRNECCGPARAIAGLLQRLGFCMGPATILRPAGASNMSARVNNHATNGRIGPDTPEAALRKLQRKAHVSFIRVR